MIKKFFIKAKIMRSYKKYLTLNVVNRLPLDVTFECDDKVIHDYINIGELKTSMKDGLQLITRDMTLGRLELVTGSCEIYSYNNMMFYISLSGKSRVLVRVWKNEGLMQTVEDYDKQQAWNLIHGRKVVPPALRKTLVLLG